MNLFSSKGRLLRSLRRSTSVSAAGILVGLFIGFQISGIAYGQTSTTQSSQTQTQPQTQTTSPTQTPTEPQTQPQPSTTGSTDQPMPTPEQLQKDAQSEGYSPEQLRMMGIDLNNPQQAMERARALGVPESEIQGYLRKYGQQGTEQQSTGQAELDLLNPAEPQQTQGEAEKAPQADEGTEEQTPGDLFGEEQSGTVKEDNIPPEPVVTDEMAGKGRFLGLNYFGYPILRAGQGDFKAIESGPVDPGYIISAGDVLRLYLWGDVEFQYEMTVDKAGNIHIPNVAQVFVAGTKLENLQKSLKNFLSKYYSGLVSNPPTVFMDISLAQVHGNQIYLMGEVQRPGSYTISSFATAFNLMYSTGGPNVTGSLRDIRVLRDGKVVAHIDFYDYLLKGMSTDDMRLQDNDIVFVPPRGTTVGIAGQVKNPGIYEVKKGESLKDLIDMVGGLNADAYNFRAQIDRILPFDERIRTGADRKVIDVDLPAVLAGKKTVALADADLIRIFDYANVQLNFVDIAGGGISRPGRYELEPLATVRDLILAADSLTGDAYTGKIDIVRTREDNTQVHLSVNLAQAMAGDPGANLFLFPMDAVHVYARSEWSDLPRVTLRGYVTQAGTYALPDSMTVYDLLFRYSGLQDSARWGRVNKHRGDVLRLLDDGETRELISFNLEDVWQQKPGANVTLQDQDEVVVYNRFDKIPTPWVELRGHAKRPGMFVMADSLTVYDLLFLHAGLEDTLFRDRTFMQRGDIFRLLSDGKTRKTITFSVEDIWNRVPGSDVALQNQDVVQLYDRNVLEMYNRQVSLDGSVKSPGVYPLKQNMTLADLILLGGGFTERAWVNEAEISRVDLAGIPGETMARIIRVPLTDWQVAQDNPEKSLTDFYLEHTQAASFYLQPYDQVRIRSNPDYSLPKNVSVEGEVLFPGQYTLQKENEKLSEVIARAGGLTELAHIEGGQLIRDNERMFVDFEELLKNHNKKEDVILHTGDRIVVPKQPNSVYVNGEVINPGLYKFYQGKRVKAYLKEAGGKTKDAGEAYITYPSGRTYKIGWLRNPKVKDGSTVHVLAKPPEEAGQEIDWTSIIKDTMAIVSSSLTIVVLATRLNN